MTRAKWAPYPLRDAGLALHNPYCGMYTLYRFYLHEDTVPDLGYAIEDTVFRPEQSLCLVEINLVCFNDRLLSADALERAGRILGLFCEHGKDMIVRFLYDWNGRGLECEPEDIGVILEHMRQLSPVLQKFGERIYMLQGLFIGSWGEMHSSRYLDPRSLRTLAKRLYESCGDTTFLAVRTPAQWRTLFRTSAPLSPDEAHKGGMKARFGLYNDAILGSDTDLGTYGEAAQGKAKDYTEKWTRGEELRFQDSLCAWVPNGGETVHGTGHSRFADVAEAMRSMHVSYLNADYDSEAYQAWRRMPLPAQEADRKDRTAYDVLSARLGYRYLAGAVRITPAGFWKKGLLVRIQMHNTGFSPCYRPLEAAVILESQGGRQAYPVGTDVRRWMPGSSVWIRAEIDPPTRGVCRLGLRLTDPRDGRAIQLANIAAPEDGDGVYFLGELGFDPR